MQNILESSEFIKKRHWILYLFISVVIAFSYVPIHEFGHLIASWISGIPTGMSYAQSYPLNGQAQTVLGGLGGPTFTVLLAYIGVLFIYKRKFLIFAYPLSTIMCLDRIFNYLLIFFFTDAKTFLITNKGLADMEERHLAEMLNINPYTFFAVFQGLELFAMVLILCSMRYNLKKSIFIVLSPIIAIAPMFYIGLNVVERKFFPEQYKMQFGVSIFPIQPLLLSVGAISLLIALVLLASYIRRKITNKRGWMLVSIVGVLVIFLGVLVILVKANSYTQKTNAEISINKPTGYQQEIESYVNFLETTPNTDPVDYVINLFDKNDIVVLCERSHPEITQYELIYKIVSDKRFIEKSGCIFTEVGTQTIDERLNKFLKNDGLTEIEVDKQLIAIYRDLPWMGYWEKYNFYDFIKKVHCLNSTLPKSEKISINGSDMPIDWDNITQEKYEEEISDRLNIRDKIMADFIADKYKEIKKGVSPRKKVLVIMNYRHAFKLIKCNTIDYLNKEFPGKVSNVMINSIKLLPGSTDQNAISEPIQKGMWDAAFRYVDKTNLAFDFRNTPFGKDHFDYYDFIPHEYKYQDIFDGFIFYYPLEKHLLVSNIPGFLDDSFLSTFNNRRKIITPNITDLISSEETYRQYNTKFEQYYPDMKSYNNDIEQWLKY